jgi:GH15 family glucan-1,4-alpha-glucosidase
VKKIATDLLSDCHSVALVSREGSVDWCCMPRVDSASVFGRLLDADRGILAGRVPGPAMTTRPPTRGGPA